MSKANIIQVKGDVEAVNQQGTTRPIKIGDELLAGETLRTGFASEVVLGYDEQRITLGANEEIFISPQWFAELEASETAVMPESADSILALLDQEGDLLAELEATAAGGGAETANSGSSFVRLTRIAEATEPLLFEALDFVPSASLVVEDDPSILVNEATVTVADSATTNEDTAVIIDLMINDSDIDGPVSPVASVTQGTNGSVAINADGTVTYTPACHIREPVASVRLNDSWIEP